MEKLVITQLDDTELQTQFSGFYRDNFLKVKLTLVFMGVDEETAKDISQEAFAKLWSAWTQFETDAARMGFMKVVSKNLWIDRCRKSKYEGMYLSEAAYANSLSSDMLYYKELLEATEKALEPFKDDYRKIYFEIKLNGCSYKEVSERFQINIKTLERHMTKMSKTVRGYLEKYYAHLSLLVVLLNF
ncbi:RNA polymerase sigma factor [Sphingobacterium paucimobilis]|uniref:RNA polymerase sigma-70 region 2 domain-containing protein n=1 Tax=Sphingobacterium paucimobilis HER1398 TaxID=1346330 RepID=U2J685_9SPHI|nr:RNA polymerase sigma factor [Sphingobacterium paucimobilis]ERJ58163.1 hypothetical protein M472_05235 [Sphingobacterium paucimobilis HER1398]